MVVLRRSVLLNCILCVSISMRHAADIQKSGGCNHMTCVSCRHQFCWLCFEDYKVNAFTAPRVIYHCNDNACSIMFSNRCDRAAYLTAGWSFLIGREASLVWHHCVTSCLTLTHRLPMHAVWILQSRQAVFIGVYLNLYRAITV